MDKFKSPIDYEKTIEDTVKLICDYYKGKIEREAHKMSKEKYAILLDAHKQLVEKSKDDCFWKNRSWYSWADLLNLSDMRYLAERFFEAAKDYKDRKALNLDYSMEEERLSNEVKTVKIMAASHSRVCAGVLSNVKALNWLFASHVKK